MIMNLILWFMTRQLIKTKGEKLMSIGCCNECGYKADYIIDNNNYADNGYENLNQVPTDKMLCGACYNEESKNEHERN